MRRVISFGPAVCYAALIFFLSSQSSFPVPARLWDFDKVLHCIEYGGFAATLLWALVRSGFAHRRAAILSLLIAALYGVSDETHQAFVPGRSSSPYDALADLAGASLVTGLWYATRRKTGVPT